MATGSDHTHVDEVAAEDAAARELMALEKPHNPDPPPFIPMEDTDLWWTPLPHRKPGPTTDAWGD